MHLNLIQTAYSWVAGKTLQRLVVEGLMTLVHKVQLAVGSLLSLETYNEDQHQNSHEFQLIKLCQIMYDISHCQGGWPYIQKYQIHN